jgi:SAM-dependent methyltransferase
MLERLRLRRQISNVDLVCADINSFPFSESTFGHVFMLTVLRCVHTYWGDTMSEALRVLRTHGMMTLSIPKKESSREKLLGKLSMNGLELRKVDDDTTLDYIVISKKTESGHVITSKKRSNTSLTGGLVNNDQRRQSFKASMSDSNSVSLVSGSSWLAFSLIRSRSFTY